MTKRRVRESLGATVIVAVGLAACGGQPGPAASLGEAPRYQPDNQAKATVVKSSLRPLIIDWSGQDLALLEGQSKSGLVVVKYAPATNQLELLSHCRVDGSYGYVGTTRQHEELKVTDRKDLQARFALGVGKLEAMLAQNGQLVVSTSIVGLRGTEKTVTRAELKGEDCDRATHLVTLISVGAFRIMTGSDVRGGIGGGVAIVGGAQVSGESAKKTDVGGGNEQDCGQASPTDKAPPAGCGSPLRLDLAEILEEKPLAKACAGDTVWNGTSCVARRATARAEAIRPVAAAGTVRPMIKIPAGTFMMGDADGDGMEQPPHSVNVDAFEIDATEVTSREFRDCVTAEKCSPPLTLSPRCNWHPKHRLDHPINCIRWEQARDYCKFVGKRLPTEAEWEYAARGSDGRPFPWGASPPGQRICWGGKDGTCEVGTYPQGKSPFGVEDMAGNVSEWTADQACQYDGTRCQDARIYRGGSWFSTETRDLRSTARRFRGPLPRDDVGMRCAKDGS
jgi:formylglycine-generating enzyme required for sulfatase activity